MARHRKIDHLPQGIKAQLERLLSDRDHGGYVALSAWLKDKGYDISHSAVHRYDVRLQAVMARIKASTEGARLIAQADPDEADDHSAAVLKMVQSSLFEAMTQIAHAGEAEDLAEQVKLLSQAARAIADTSRASIGQKRFATEVRGKIEALEAAQTAGGKQLDADTLAAIKAALYGG